MERDFLLALIKKTLVMMGFTYFAVAVYSQAFVNLTPSLLAGGSYLFTELIRYYKVDVTNRQLRARKKKIKQMVFLI